mmetsp:Transcript_22532/g.36517  ORF Transcript_22532/g.36517 Transcript_22532/m.36517 type:complete len:244 (-) Transcript_22532:1323-2054(-)
MSADICLPQLEAGRIHRFHEQRPFQRRVIARDHREGVERQDIATRQHPARHRIVRAVGVDAGLKPDPGVAVLGIGKAFGNLKLHRVAPRHGHVNLAGAGPDRVTDGIAAHIRDLCTVADQGDLGFGLVHPLAHGCLIEVHGGDRFQEVLHFGLLQQGQVVTFHADHRPLACDLAHGPPKIVPLPIGIGDVVTIAAPPGLTCVDARTDGHAGLVGHNAGIRTAKGAVKKAGVVGDVVHRGEDGG